jgi:hypothetical protein
LRISIDGGISISEKGERCSAQAGYGAAQFRLTNRPERVAIAHGRIPHFSPLTAGGTEIVDPGAPLRQQGERASRENGLIIRMGETSQDVHVTIQEF